MSGIRIVTGAIFALAFAAVNSATAATAEVDATLRAELDHISQRRIFFGHQSVGVNLLDGIRQLSTMAGAPVRVVETATTAEVPPATFGNAFVARNGDPLLKLQSFEHAFGQHPSGIDIALMKFCFVDFTRDTDAKMLFLRYRATIDNLRARNPGTTFVHVTAPLTVAQGGIKAMAKRLLGRPPYGTAENMRREEYNALLRQTYMGREPVFDLARIESTTPDGKTESVEWNGREVPVMAPSYTDDGGHLNTEGKLRAARELITVLAAIPDHPATSRSPR